MERREKGPITREKAVWDILAERDIHTEFPMEMEAAAAQVPEEVEEHALTGRTDLREALTFTIDGDGSKDFDDAVSWEDNGDGTVTLGVHIADVGHYVKQGSPLDEEAFQRGTSVYFADQVAPMLPRRLSNGICSLNPGVDRLTLSCIMRVDERGEVMKYHLCRSVIRSRERMTYRVCNALLDGSADGETKERYAHILPPLMGLAALDRVLTAARRRRGALELVTGERYILCDGEGKPVEVLQKGAGQSEGIIESMMLLANETVAKHLIAEGLPGVFRIHEPPTEDKLTALKTILAPLGYELRGGDNGSFQSLLKQSRGTPQEGLVNMLVLRTMMKAGYAPENEGHFGLGAEFYCHFTSPIRRYPDLVVNRILTAHLTGRDSEEERRRLGNFAKGAAVQSSQREIDAMTAEREIEKRYLAEYMECHVGEDFPATVSGVTAFGLFVALANGVEGLLPVWALPEDHYVYDEKHLTLTGEHTGTRFSFGMPLGVRCDRADGGLGQVDFLLLDEEGEPYPLRERRERRERETHAQKVIRAKKHRGRYRPPKRKGKGRGR